MKVTLDELGYLADEKDCGGALDELLQFGAVQVSQQEQDDIVSSVLRKAGTKMKQGRKNGRGIRRKIIGFVIAAAVLAIPVGAYTVSRFAHKDNVEYYLKGSERIEENQSAVKNYVMENKDYKLTIDSQLCDGHNVMLIETHEPKTDGGEFMNDKTLEVRTRQEGQEIHAVTGGYAVGKKDGIFNRTVDIVRCGAFDTDKDVTMVFYGYDKAEKSIQALDGFEFTTRCEENVKSAELKSESGRRVVLSEFEVYSPDGRQIGQRMDNVSQEFAFIGKDGKKVKISEDNVTYCVDDYIIFGEIIDPDEYKGVEIDGVQYLK